MQRANPLPHLIEQTRGLQYGTKTCAFHRDF